MNMRWGTIPMNRSWGTIPMKKIQRNLLIHLATMPMHMILEWVTMLMRQNGWMKLWGTIPIKLNLLMRV